MILTKGIIEEIVTPYKARVRMPVYHGAKNASYSTSTKDLPSATLCSMPNCSYALYPGDIVYCGIEDNDFTKPVIMGFLYKQDKAQTSVDMNLNSLNVVANTKLPDNTSVGEVSPASLQSLSGMEGRNIYDSIQDVAGVAGASLPYDTFKTFESKTNDSISELQTNIDAIQQKTSLITVSDGKIIIDGDLEVNGDLIVNGTMAFSITGDITNGTLVGSTIISFGETVSVTIQPNGGYILPRLITVTGATYTYNETTGVVTLSNVTSVVTITGTCENMVYPIS